MVTRIGLCAYLLVMLWEIVHLVINRYLVYVYSSKIFITTYCTNIMAPCEILVVLDNI